MNGTAISGERVVIVDVRRGRVNLQTGRIASESSSPAQDDSRAETVVLSDRQRRPVVESQEEACQRSFRVDDIHLLKEQEAESLLDPNTAQAWFWHHLPGPVGH